MAFNKTAQWLGIVIGVVTGILLVAWVLSSPVPTPGLNSAGNLFLETMVVLVLAGVYFAPAFIALRRHHQSAVALLMVNIFAGWTVVGWVWCFVWSLLGERET